MSYLGRASSTTPWSREFVRGLHSTNVMIWRIIGWEISAQIFHLIAIDPMGRLGVLRDEVKWRFSSVGIFRSMHSPPSLIDYWHVFSILIIFVVPLEASVPPEKFRIVLEKGSNLLKLEDPLLLFEEKLLQFLENVGKTVAIRTHLLGVGHIWA